MKSTKYIIYKDFRSIAKVEYKAIEAKTEFEAIEATEKEWDPEKHYLIRIMEKTGKVEVMTSDGWKEQAYKAVMCKRSNECGWHRNDSKHYEAEHFARRCYNKDLEYFEAI